MATPGQRFELDLEAEDFTTKPLTGSERPDDNGRFSVRDIREHELGDVVPAAPKFKATKTGFPEHQRHQKVSAFRQRQNARTTTLPKPHSIPAPGQILPSDRAIAHHVGEEYDTGFEARQKAEISSENEQRIATMSDAEIEEARAELMSNLGPGLLERLLRRANIDDGIQQETIHSTLQTEKGTISKEGSHGLVEESKQKPVESEPQSTALSTGPAIHFPVPPRSPSSFVPLDPSDHNFLADLKTHYFPEISHDPSSLSWLQDVSAEEIEDSPYNPTKDAYAAGSLRFSFKGTLIPPKDSLDIDVSEGLHHHGEAPASAGYTIPELAILTRSTLPNQRCIAYQILGRILFRLGRGDLGSRGTELQNGLWSVIEQERPIEMMMREANRAGGHVSAKAYATEALWLWRKGGGGDRGVLKEGEKIAQ